MKEPIPTLYGLNLHKFPITYTGPTGILSKTLFDMHHDFSVDPSLVVAPITIFSLIEDRVVVIYDKTFPEPHAYAIERKEFKNVRTVEKFIKKIIRLDSSRKHIIMYLLNFIPDKDEQEYLKLKYV
jgi:hypothetical protein